MKNIIKILAISQIAFVYNFYGMQQKDKELTPCSYEQVTNKEELKTIKNNELKYTNRTTTTTKNWKYNRTTITTSTIPNKKWNKLRY